MIRDSLRPFGAVPSPRQRAWHALEYYGFLHFTVNTFTDREWGLGNESPAIFNPTEFDATQIAAVAQQAGMAGLILTAKHHDGFCLWPSRHTTHSVAQSPWRNGHGDVVAELAQACAQVGLKFGIYLSPWDRNHCDYGTPAYLTYYRDQLRELLSNYGPLFEVWFDGANGGDGYYGGTYEVRHIDNTTYYAWDDTFALVRELQPEACIFSDAGPDVRWVGNEHGIAGDPCWSTLTRDGLFPGAADPQLLNSGQRHGTEWVPAECDVSIRPGWFYHAHEDQRVRSGHNLLDLYMASVGRGANLLLNLPITPAGLVHAHDQAALREFSMLRQQLFARPLAATVTPSSTHPLRPTPAFLRHAEATDDYWMPDPSDVHPMLTFTFPTTQAVALIDIREYLPLGQRIDEIIVDALTDTEWHEVARCQSIGNRRLLRLEGVTTSALRIRIPTYSALPALRTCVVYAP